jgi:hypothetical protein
VKLFRLQTNLELLAHTKAFLRSAHKLRVGYDTYVAADLRYVFTGCEPNVDPAAWKHILERLFCFPAGRRTHNHVVKLVSHCERSYHLRINYLARGWSCLVAAQLALQFRSLWPTARVLQERGIALGNPVRVFDFPDDVEHILTQWERTEQGIRNVFHEPR